MNLRPKEYYALTISQFYVLQEGYKRKLEVYRSETVNSWRQTRLLAYLIAQPNLKDQNKSIYDFYPLPDDPTPEQIEQATKEEHEKDSKWMKNVINNFRKTKRN